MKDLQQMQAKLENQKGFTLVEIAIVLVIIGLLLGGVLKGQELIENAKVKSITRDFENITAAYYSYQDRKGVYPDTSSNGSFWLALKQEGFISGPYTDSANTTGPTHAFDGEYFVVAATGGGFQAKNYVCANNITGEIGQNLDTVNDDGLYNNGSIRSVANGTTAPTATAAAVAYPTDGTAIMLCKEL
jgi:prepilin-type N-terminal cleavage/methylation domain-containing protein